MQSQETRRARVVSDTVWGEVRDAAKYPPVIGPPQHTHTECRSRQTDTHTEYRSRQTDTYTECRSRHTHERERERKSEHTGAENLLAQNVKMSKIQRLG